MQSSFRASLCGLVVPALFTAACTKSCSTDEGTRTESEASELRADEIGQADHARFADWPAYGETLPVPDTLQIHRLRGQREGLTSLSAENPDAALDDIVAQIDHLLGRLGWEVTGREAFESGGDGARQWRASHPDVPAIHLTAEALSGPSGVRVQIEWELLERERAP